jgi:WD40 repeat protein
VAVTPDGERVITGSDDQTVTVWNLKSGAEEQTLRGHQGGVWTVAVTPDGERAITGSGDQTVKVWNLKGDVICAFTCEGRVFSLAVAPDGCTVVAGDTGGIVYFLRLENL